MIHVAVKNGGYLAYCKVYKVYKVYKVQTSSCSATALRAVFAAHHQALEISRDIQSQINVCTHTKYGPEYVRVSVHTRARTCMCMHMHIYTLRAQREKKENGLIFFPFVKITGRYI